MYEISYEPFENYLRVFLKGDLAAPATRVEAWAQLIERCRADQYERLIVVQDSPGNGTAANAHISSVGIVELGLEGIKIAFVDLDPRNHEDNKFGEMVAANRGADAKVFTEEVPALEWLLGN